jgi:hypothetical protein
MAGEPYDAVGSNCEHFVRQALGLPRESPQLRGTLLGLGALATLLLVLRIASSSRPARA